MDFVVFDGLDEGELRRIVFVEIKTGGATLSARERRIRDAIQRGDVEWRELRLGADQVSVPSHGSGGVGRLFGRQRERR